MLAKLTNTQLNLLLQTYIYYHCCCFPRPLLTWSHILNTAQPLSKKLHLLRALYIPVFACELFYEGVESPLVLKLSTVPAIGFVLGWDYLHLLLEDQV